MSLLNWAGALWLLLVPLLILIYMLRPKRLRMPVSSLRLWRALPEVERSRARLHRPPLSLLLILQAIALILGAIALAQPALTAPEGRLSVVIVDASGTMQAIAGAQSRFDDARDRAMDIVSSMGPQDRVTLLRAGASATTECSECDRAEVERALDGLRPGAGTADVAGALDAAAGIARKGQGGVIPVTVISDGAFDPASLGDLSALPLSLSFVRVGQPVQNRTVAALSVRRPPDGRSGYVAFARIENRGSTPALIQVAARADTVPLPVRTQTVPPGGQSSITWQVPAGTARFSVDISPGDSLAADDRAVVFLPAPGQYPVRVHSEQPDLYRRVLAGIEGLRTVTNTDVPSPAFTIIEGALPNPLPAGNLMLVDPRGDFLTSKGEVRDLRPAAVDVSHPVVAGLDLTPLRVTQAQAVEPPDRLETVVDSTLGPLVMVGDLEGRRMVVLTFDPRDSNLTKLAAFPLMMANVVEWLYPLAGTQAVEPGRPVQAGAGARVETPSGRAVEVGADGLFAATDENGIYSIQVPGGATLQFAVNPKDDPEPADSDSLAHPELTRPLEIERLEETATEVFWMPLVALALALLVGEWLVYTWKRGSI
jgi:Ca-activated chloride channel family protein